MPIIMLKQNPPMLAVSDIWLMLPCTFPFAISTDLLFHRELLAVIVARRVLAHHEGEDPMILFGPSCFNRSGALTCSDPGLPVVSSLTVASEPDGRRDPINPVTRTISMQFLRPFEIAPVHYDVEVRFSSLF